MDWSSCAGPALCCPRQAWVAGLVYACVPPCDQFQSRDEWLNDFCVLHFQRKIWKACKKPEVPINWINSLRAKLRQLTAGSMRRLTQNSCVGLQVVMSTSASCWVVTPFSRKSFQNKGFLVMLKVRWLEGKGHGFCLRRLHAETIHFGMQREDIMAYRNKQVLERRSEPRIPNRHSIRAQIHLNSENVWPCLAKLYVRSQETRHFRTNVLFIGTLVNMLCVNLFDNAMEL